MILHRRVPRATSVIPPLFHSWLIIVASHDRLRQQFQQPYLKLSLVGSELLELRSIELSSCAMNDILDCAIISKLVQELFCRRIISDLSGYTCQLRMRDNSVPYLTDTEPHRLRIIAAALECSFAFDNCIFESVRMLLSGISVGDGANKQRSFETFRWIREKVVYEWL